MKSEINCEITVIILTLNEEFNISYCLNNVSGWAKEIIVLDSYSEDSTIPLAKSFGAKVFFRHFDNYANQRNYAVKELPISNDWILFLDADEWLTEELKQEISEVIQNTHFDGFLIKRRLYFLGKWIRHGGNYPIWNLRLFRKGIAMVEREVNEHIKINGKIGRLKYDMVDENRKGLTFWLHKHIGYARMEAKQFNLSNGLTAKFWGNPIERKSWIRNNIWNKISIPLIRPFIYFFYTYIIRLGFLDGRVGFIYRFLHDLWYIFLIDVFHILGKVKDNDQNID